MLSPWLELPHAAAQIDALSDAAELDLKAHGTESDADTIRDTAIAQPLIVSMSLIALRALVEDRDPADVAEVTAGHSVGEFTAAATAGVLTDTSAVSLVAQRARFMAQAAADNPSGMAAILGGEPVAVDEAIAAAGAWPANVNGAGQTVAAGSNEAMAALVASPPEKARVRPLEVAGAFHTPLMESAGRAFREVTASWSCTGPGMALLSNTDGEVVNDGRTYLDRLAHQITAPVRWDLCQAQLAALGVTAIIELAPGGVLAGLARRTLPEVTRIAITSPDDLATAREVIADHGKGSA